VTDANLVLGRLDPAAMPGVEHPVPVDRVRDMIERVIGRPLGLDARAAAAAILAVATNHLAGAIRMVSIERGEDPRDYAVFAFGGAGALHATALARELGIPKVLVPRYPGATSALGCILADLRHDFVRSVGRPLLDCDGAEMDAILAEHRAAGEAQVADDGVPIEGLVVKHEADLLFRGQSHVFRIPVTGPGFDPGRVFATFCQLYRARFEIELGEMRAMLASLRTTVLGTRRSIDGGLFARHAAPAEPAIRQREVWFDGRGWETAILRREHLAVGATISGPAIIEQLDATTVLDPGASLTVDPSGNLVIAVGDIA